MNYKTILVVFLILIVYPVQEACAPLPTCWDDQDCPGKRCIQGACRTSHLTGTNDSQPSQDGSPALLPDNKIPEFLVEPGHVDKANPQDETFGESPHARPDKDISSSFAKCSLTDKEKKNSKVVETSDKATFIGVNSIFTFAGQTDGKPFKGLRLKGNANAIYGNGVGKTIFQSDSIVEGNGHKICGASFEGSLHFKGNRPALQSSVVYNDLISEKNDGVFTDVIVFGKLTIKGNNNKLNRVYVAGTIIVNGKSNNCQSTYRFQDKNNDKKVEPSERQGLWSCKGK